MSEYMSRKESTYFLVVMDLGSKYTCIGFQQTYGVPRRPGVSLLTTMIVPTYMNLIGIKEGESVEFPTIISYGYNGKSFEIGYPITKQRIGTRP